MDYAIARIVRAKPYTAPWHNTGKGEKTCSRDVRVKDVVADLVKTHVLALKEAIDVQAAGDAARAYVALRHAADHMAMIANPLADAIAKQFPTKYAL
jgi:hypothetical protein